MSSPRKTGKSPRNTPPVRKSVAPASRAKNRPHWRLRLVAGLSLSVLLLFLWAALARQFAPRANTARTRFDTLIVLGSPANSDGNPTALQLSKVNEAVHEYERGVAPHILFTGGAAHNRFVAAQVMARAAQAEGVPSSAILIEDQAQDTLQNACYSVHLMQQRGWSSAEVIAAPYHLPRVAMIFRRMPIEWSMHPAEPLMPGAASRWDSSRILEPLKTVRFLTWARLTERCEP